MRKLAAALLVAAFAAAPASAATSTHDQFQAISLQLKRDSPKHACSRTIPGNATVVLAVHVGRVAITQQGQQWSTSMYVSGNGTMVHLTTTLGTSPICMRAMTWNAHQTVTMAVSWSAL